MPEILDHVAYLSQQIGPRPAGTEEEQQAALYITEQMQKEAGLSAVIEDFSGAGRADAPRAICCGATLVVAVLALFLSVMVIPALIVSLIALLLLVAEVLDRPVLSKTFARGVSQNVVAKYEPGYTSEAGGSRRRKIILVARYDSGKVRSELKQPFLSALPVLRWVNLGAMAAVPLLLVLRATLFLHAAGTTEIVLNVLMAIVLVLVALPVLEALAHKFAAYNEAANCNASGVSVLLDVARRVGRGRVSEAELAARAEGAAIHGEEAARAAGLVPEGVEIVYAASNVKPPELAPQSEAARLAAAKAAVAALTGKPVSGRLSTDLAENLVQVKEPPLPSPTDVDFQSQRGETREAFTTIPAETVQAALANAEAAALNGAEAAAAAAAGIPTSFPPAPAPAAEPVSSDGVPDWFKKAQEKAKKPVDNKQVHRSRYADALDAALGDNAEGPAEEPPTPPSDMEVRLQSMREGIMEVKAPQANRSDESPAGGQTETFANTVAVAMDGAAPETVPAQASATMPEVRFKSHDGADAPDTGATCAMPPIDVSELRLGDVPPMGDVPMPSFLDPAKAQAEKLEERGEVNRTANRVDVTAAPIGDSGRIELQSAQGAPSVQPAGAPVPVSPEGGEAAPASQRRPIVLPDIGVAAANLTPITELPKQRAPLAEAETSGKSAAKSLLTMLPSIEPVSDTAIPAVGDAPAVPAPQRPDLRAALPSLSGAIARPDEAAVSTAGAFVPAGATGAFAPVGDELLENVDPDDIYVDDADDSAYEGEYTETGAFAGTGYVEMPKSRAHRFLDKLRFRKRKEEEEPTPQEWLEVDETFDARTAGAARGGWESFREEQSAAPDYYEETYEDDAYVDDGEEDSYLAPLVGKSPEDTFAGVTSASPAAGFADDDFSLDDVDEYEDDAFRSDAGRRWNGGGFSRLRMGRANDVTPEELNPEDDLRAAHPDDPATPPELKEIYQFRNPDINTEVWFVALGSELAQHGGMHAFLAEHNQDLRGSIIIDIDALGAGELCMIEREGMYRKAKASSRMKRYTKKASQATGLSIGAASIMWEDSAASIAIKQGFQAMHLAGMDGAKPAFFAQGDDVLENIDEETLNNNAEFVMELLKNI
ncbi:aminopeptidase [Gordonibacter urolithinfaciens]|uniref:aminopeptidase n=1 Tax=Gordonibacter urolithinfaciens TaxID=1335613 RepID=UPI001D05D960|nr:aminopeptidase [Gordonibacter urolithinfaciens]MCB6560667.1 aminopeptidase [Gordonibacter urolithinfaciens]MCB7086226.1 aminopeptidase [Gordonibacter urolithinfaciens]